MDNINIETSSIKNRFKRLIIISTIIVIGLILKAYSLIPQSYFSKKTNIFNRYFVKFGWAWTICLLGPFIYLTSMRTHRIFEIITNHLSRLIIATGIWYVITNLFVFIESRTGTCKHKDWKDVTRYVCLEQGHEWVEGLDISGHTFLLLYAILIINEEIKNLDLSPNSTQNTQTSRIYQYLIRLIYIALNCLTILWGFMLISTILYFHYIYDIIIAAFCAFTFWFLTYHIWYQSHSTSLLYPAKPDV